MTEVLVEKNLLAWLIRGCNYYHEDCTECHYLKECAKIADVVM